jgi:hypothetical protein
MLWDTTVKTDIEIKHASKFKYAHTSTKHIIFIKLLCNSLKRSGNYIYHLLQQPISLRFCDFRAILNVNSDYFLKQR